jgi:hypothetical protein
MSTPGESLSQEPQEERGAPGSRDTGSDEPSGGPTDRPSGKYEGDESVPSYGAEGETGSVDRTGEMPPQDTGRAIPPYEGRQTTAKPVGDEGDAERAGARTGGATRPVEDSSFKDPAPGQTPGGATASPADEQRASAMPESDRDDDRVGPAHAAGTGRAEDKR